MERCSTRRSLRRRRFFMTKTEKVCSCFGHFDVEITDELKARTSEEIDKAIADGVRVFLFGGRSDFDELVYEIVTEKRAKNSQLGLKRVFCVPMERDLRRPQAWLKHKDYESCECPMKTFDGWYKSLYFRNCAMIEQSDLVLFYAEERQNSGAYKAYKYAVKAHKKIVNLALS